MGHAISAIHRPGGSWQGAPVRSFCIPTFLPELPIPKHVAVTKDFIEIDGWVFPLSQVSKGILVWV